MNFMIKSKTKYVKHQPIFGHSKSPEHRGRKNDKWVKFLQKNMSKF